jgi:hypothetical protein
VDHSAITAWRGCDGNGAYSDVGAPGHVHLLAALVRQDLRTASAWKDKLKAQRACRDLEDRYNLYRVGPPAASGAFASAGPPTLAPIDSSAAFLTEYQHRRGRAFTAVEREVAWAASLWTAAHNARWDALHGDAPVSGNALRAQAAERLRRADA